MMISKMNRQLLVQRISLCASLCAGTLLLAGCGGKQDDTAAAPVTPGAGKQASNGAPSIRAQRQAAGGGVPGAPQGTPGAIPGSRPGGLAGGAPQSDPFQVASAGGRTPNKKDPFFPTWHTDPPPPYIFGEITPIRVADQQIETPPVGDVTVREVPTRRVSGIMSGDGIYAIIEQNGESEIVKPGSRTKDGYTVVSIDNDTVKLRRKDNNIIRTQTVPLSDESTGGQATGGQGRFGGGGAFGGQGAGMPGPAGMGGGGGGGGSAE